MHDAMAVGVGQGAKQFTGDAVLLIKREREGRALLLLSEEIRANVARGTEAARDLTSVVDELAAESIEVRRQIERSRAESGDLGQEASRIRASCEHGTRALGELAQRLRQATGVDPEVARAVTQAAEHARGLMSALSTLTTATAQSGTVAAALRPVLGPLSRLIGEVGGEPESGPPSSADPGEGPA